MPATIIISVILAVVIGLIIYRMIKNARSGRGSCAGCPLSTDCPVAEYVSKKSGCTSCH